MYPILRLVKTLLSSRKEKINYLHQDSIQFRCHPWDIDIFREMNNGRMITLFDLGRISLVSKCGFLRVLLKNKWGLVVAGSSVMYRKRIRAFDKITMYTRVVGIDDKWIYLEQSMWVKGVPCCSMVIRTAVTSKNGLVDTKDVLDTFGEKHSTVSPEVWVTNWIENEKDRSWPPNVEMGYNYFRL